ncbi:LptF/LptG family permease [Asticcacaulis sp. 201]|uniref:LptF/LptG family permease n=1 Tax=Asticcacaulis sp. 201 TaxID=3028787 RepID=UPI002917049A|nr:LptF/LptG family permease [Asticcacaulis sp. 201]MDV6329492.1 LptF/LptG family permease [Asticcacaulis sp. 201]
MRTLDRYIFRQLILPIGGAVAALTAIALLSQSLTQFDLVVERGQSAWVFIKITLLSMPQLAGLIFPIALFVGTLVALTRMQGEHEFTAAYASGMSLMRIAYPILRIGIYLTLISLMVNLFIQPLTNRAMRQELFDVKNDLLSSLVKEGDFATSPTGLTIYVQRIDQNGLLRQLFIRTDEAGGRDRTFAAREGRIVKVDGSSVLVMRNGSNQQLTEKGVIEHQTWDQASFDITSYFASDDYLQFKEGDRYMHELLFPVAYAYEKSIQGKYVAEANARLANPLYNLAFVLLAIVSVLGGRFSRNGYAQRIGVAAVVALTIRIFGVVVETASASAWVLNLLQYIVPMIPIFVCLHLIRKHDGTTGRVHQAIRRDRNALQPL